jgi:uncharacterized membrane protein YhaH (DUF805 family)
MTESCPYCRETVAESEGLRCPTCKTPHHSDCWQENGGCTVFGCEHAPADEPKVALTASDFGRAPATSTAPVGGAALLILRNGQQLGPHSESQLRQYVESGVFSSTDLVWRAGMREWTPLSHILPGLRPPQQFVSARLSVSTPPQPDQASDPLGDRPHFGRILYLVSTFGAGFVGGLFMSNSSSAPLGSLIMIIGIGVALVLRLRDIGHSGWWALLMFVPVGNLVIGIMAISAPRGYAITKKADTAMKVLGWITLGFFVLIILGIALGK